MVYNQSSDKISHKLSFDLSNSFFLLILFILALTSDPSLVNLYSDSEDIFEVKLKPS